MLKASFEAIDDHRAFEKWVRQAQPGEVCLYHVGLLMADRQCAEGLEKLEKMIKIKDAAVSTAAFSDQGLVTLVQQRLGEGQYEYFAVRTNKPAAPLSVPQVAEAA